MRTQNMDLNTSGEFAAVFRLRVQWDVWCRSKFKRAIVQHGQVAYISASAGRSIIEPLWSSQQRVLAVDSTCVPSWAILGMLVHAFMLNRPRY